MPAITIFEGPDGGGKTTAAKKYAKETKALYYHFSAWRHMGPHLPRLFLEAMQPALLGYANVVLDRSWISEEPYNTVYHKASTPWILPRMCSMLERVAMRCETNIVMCLPPKEQCIENFNSRRKDEMLADIGQLSDVYDRYKDFRKYQRCSLPAIEYDYTKDGRIEEFLHGIPFGLMKHSRKCMKTVGAFTAPYIIVGDLSRRMDIHDILHRWPTVKFNRDRMEGFDKFVEVLSYLKVDEIDLLWIDKSAVEETIERRLKIGFPIKGIMAFDLESGEAAIRAMSKVPRAERPNIHMKKHPDEYMWTNDFLDHAEYYNIF